MRIPSESEPWNFLREQLRLEEERPPAWPRNVRTISEVDYLFLGIDDQHQLYWDGKPIRGQHRVKLSRAQFACAVVIGLLVLAAGLGVGLNQSFDFGCKMGWWSAAGCPR
jgi:hypothetical protein